MDFLELKDKKIIVTGASVGIGLQTAQTLSAHGAKLILIARSRENLESALANLHGNGHSIFSIDLGLVDEIESKSLEILENSGSIDGLVHCAGVRSRRPLAMLKPNILEEVMRVNFFSFIELVRCFSKKGRFNNPFSIVGVSSIAAISGGPGVTAYAASKAAMEGAVRCLAAELAPKGIRINTVQPAQINTPAFKELVENNANGEDKTLARQYLGLGETEDIAHSIAFLLSSKSKFITGTALPVDGGYLSS